MGLWKIFNDYWEDESDPLLGPTKKGLQVNGMYQNSHGLKKYVQNLVHSVATVFVLTQYIELWIIRADLESAQRNLSTTMLSSVCVVKAWTFVTWQTNWKEIMSAVSQKELNQLKDNDGKTGRIMREYIKYSRLVTFFYWALVIATVFAVIFSPLVAYLSSENYRQRIRNGTAPNPEIMSSWVPFDKTESYGYSVYVLLHTVIVLWGGGIVAAYDSNAVTLMSFFAGQLKLLRHDCTKLFDRKISDCDALAKIRQYHQQHWFLVNYYRQLNSLLSPVLFVYIIIFSLMICASAIQLSQEGTSRVQQIWIMEYLMALIAQLFLYCWHGNQVLYMSNKVEDGIYESGWWKSNVRLRRSVLLLGGQLRRSFVLNAGPFFTLTVQTFVTILKGSYSYYAILSKNSDSSKS